MLHLQRSKLQRPLAPFGELVGRQVTQIGSEPVFSPIVPGSVESSQRQSSGRLVDGLPDLFLRLVAQTLEQRRGAGEVCVGPEGALNGWKVAESPCGDEGYVRVTLGVDTG